MPIQIAGKVTRIARIPEDDGLVTYFLVLDEQQGRDVLIAVLPNEHKFICSFVEKGDNVVVSIKERVRGPAHVAEALRIKGLEIQGLDRNAS